MITRDFSVISNDVTGVSLSLYYYYYYYYSQKSLTHNIGSASALSIILPKILRSVSVAHPQQMCPVTPLNLSVNFFCFSNASTVSSVLRSNTAVSSSLDSDCHLSGVTGSDCRMTCAHPTLTLYLDQRRLAGWRNKPLPREGLQLSVALVLDQPLLAILQTSNFRRQCRHSGINPPLG